MNIEELRVLNRLYFLRVGLVQKVEPSGAAGRDFYIHFVHPVTVPQLKTLEDGGFMADGNGYDRHLLRVRPPWYVLPSEKRPASISPESYRRDGYGKKQREGECKVLYDLGQVRMAVEHITQDDEDGVYFAHLKGLDTPLRLNGDDRLIVEWRTLLNKAYDYVPEPQVVAVPQASLEKPVSLNFYEDYIEVIDNGYELSLEAEVQQQYSRVFEAGVALSPFDQIRIMANEIESLREKNALLDNQLQSRTFAWERTHKDLSAANTELEQANAKIKVLNSALNDARKHFIRTILESGTHGGQIKIGLYSIQGFKWPKPCFAVFKHPMPSIGITIYASSKQSDATFDKALRLFDEMLTQKEPDHE